MKRTLLFFQLLAAASAVFAMGLGGVYYLNTRPDAAQPLAQENSFSTSPVNKAQETSVDPDVQTAREVQHDHNSRGNQESGKSVLVPQKKNNTTIIKLESSSFIEQNASNEFSNERSVTNTNRPLPKLIELETPTLKIANNEPDPGMVLLAKLKDEERKYQQEKPKVNEKLWSSLGMSAGTFNPSATASVKSLNAFGTAATSSDPSSGTSYSVGLSVAGKISRRIVLQGGVSYLSQNAQYTSSAASGAKASLNEFAATSSDHIVATSPYQVNNNLQYMSIPVQVGYIIIDQTFAVQLNGGVSTDVFFQNTLTPEDSELDKVTQGAGSDSPYRTLNFSGLLGTELSYKVGDHYRIAVNPGLRYALNSIYKSEVATENSPVTFDVALRFRYIFK